MTTVELRTSIVSDINLMNAEMLESVSRYIKRLTSHHRNLATHSTDRHETAMQFVKNLFRDLHPTETSVMTQLTHLVPEPP